MSYRLVSFAFYLFLYCNSTVQYSIFSMQHSFRIASARSDQITSHSHRYRRRHSTVTLASIAPVVANDLYLSLHSTHSLVFHSSPFSDFLVVLCTVPDFSLLMIFDHIIQFNSIRLDSILNDHVLIRKQEASARLAFVRSLVRQLLTAFNLLFSSLQFGDDTRSCRLYDLTFFSSLLFSSFSSRRFTY